MGLRVRPLGDRVVIIVDEKETKSPGGILLPDVAKDEPRRGKVIAVGPGKRKDDGTRHKMEIKKNDIVLFNIYGGSKTKLENKEYLVLNEAEVLGVVEDDE